MPTRLLQVLKNPGEVVTAVFAVAFSTTAGTVAGELSATHSLLGLIVPAVVSFFGLAVVYFFKFRIEEKKLIAQAHTTDAATTPNTIAGLTALIQQLRETQTESLKQQREDFLLILKARDEETHLVRAEKHKVAGDAQMWRTYYMMISDRARTAGCDLDQLFAPPLRPFTFEDFMQSDGKMSP